MLDYKSRHTGWSGWLRRNGKMLQTVREAVLANGPMGNGDFEGRRPAGPGGWWSWRPVQHALHHLWMTGALTIHSAPALPEALRPARARDPARARIAPVTTVEFQRWHLERSLRAMGAATELDLARYLTFLASGLAPAASRCARCSSAAR